MNLQTANFRLFGGCAGSRIHPASHMAQRAAGELFYKNAQWQCPACGQIMQTVHLLGGGREAAEKRMIRRHIQLGCKAYNSANVCDHRHRTDGATDAGEERASASGVTAGRCSVDRSVRVLSPSGYGVTLQERPLREGEVVEIKDAHIEIQSDSGYQLSVKTETHEGGHV